MVTLGIYARCAHPPLGLPFPLTLTLSHRGERGLLVVPKHLINEEGMNG